MAQSVGFYYMSNAIGRLTGTLISGALYSTLGWDGTQNNVNIGIAWCFFAGTISSILAAMITVEIRDDKAVSSHAKNASRECCKQSKSLCPVAM